MTDSEPPGADLAAWPLAAIVAMPVLAELVSRAGGELTFTDAELAHAQRQLAHQRQLHWVRRTPQTWALCLVNTTTGGRDG